MAVGDPEEIAAAQERMVALLMEDVVTVVNVVNQVAVDLPERKVSQDAQDLKDVQVTKVTEDTMVRMVPQAEMDARAKMAVMVNLPSVEIVVPVVTRENVVNKVDVDLVAPADAKLDSQDS